jgi:hypothetical protein
MLSLLSQQRVVATVEESVLKTDMEGLESQEEDAPKRRKRMLLSVFYHCCTLRPPVQDRDSS